MSNYSLEDVATKVSGGDSWITKNMFETNGPLSIDLTQIVAKSIIVHVGNYYDKDGTKQLANDGLAYDSATDTYGGRNLYTVPFSDPDHPLAWGNNHFDINSAHIIPPFASISAAARFCVQNFGSDISVMFIIHGHVCWINNLDLEGLPSYKVKDVGNWAAFANVCLVGGAPGDKNIAGSHKTTFSENGASVGRIDFDKTFMTQTKLANWWRGPAVQMEGLNFVFNNSTTSTNANAADVKMRWSKGTGGGGFHNSRNIRMRCYNADSNGYFYPFEHSENAIHYIHSSVELSINRHMTICEVRNGGTCMFFPTSTGTLYLTGDSANRGIRTGGVFDRGTFVIGSGGRFKYSSSAVPDKTLNTFGFGGGFGFASVYRSGPYYLSGNGTVPVEHNGWYNINNLGNYYNNAPQGTLSNSTYLETYASSDSGRLVNKTSGWVTAGTGPLGMTTLTGNSGFKGNLTSRTANPYSNQ